jgi:hypothetical protein
MMKMKIVLRPVKVEGSRLLYFMFSILKNNMFVFVLFIYKSIWNLFHYFFLDDEKAWKMELNLEYICSLPFGEYIL